MKRVLQKNWGIQNKRKMADIGYCETKPTSSYAYHEYGRNNMDVSVLQYHSLDYHLLTFQDTSAQTKKSRNVLKGRANTGDIAFNDRSGITC